MKQEINALIEKYYQGKSTADEEESLKLYLKNNTEVEYDALRSQFQIMDNIFDSEDQLDNSFDEKILKVISPTGQSRKKHFHLQRTLSGVAATVLILISIWVVSSLLSPKEVYGTINDPQAAFTETKKALQKVSKNVKKGVAPATKTIKKAESGLDKTKNIKKLNNTGQLLKSMTKVTVRYGKS